MKLRQRLIVGLVRCVIGLLIYLLASSTARAQQGSGSQQDGISHLASHFLWVGVGVAIAVVTFFVFRALFLRRFAAGAMIVTMVAPFAYATGMKIIVALGTPDEPGARADIQVGGADLTSALVVISGVMAIVMLYRTAPSQTKTAEGQDEPPRTTSSSDYTLPPSDQAPSESGPITMAEFVNRLEVLPATSSSSIDDQTQTERLRKILLGIVVYDQSQEEVFRSMKLDSDNPRDALLWFKAVKLVRRHLKPFHESYLAISTEGRYLTELRQHLVSRGEPIPDDASLEMLLYIAVKRLKDDQDEPPGTDP